MFLTWFFVAAGFLGLKDATTRSPEGKDTVEELLTIWEMQMAEVQAILQTISPTEVIPSNYPDVASSLKALPAVVEWMQRSAYRRGVSMALALGSAHFPDEWVHDDITSGWLSETGVVDELEVLKELDRATPFVDRVRRMDGLLPYLHTQIPDGDSPVEPRDLPSERPIESARQGKLSTFKTRAWIPAHRREAPGPTEASSSKTAEAPKDPAKDA